MNHTQKPAQSASPSKSASPKQNPGKPAGCTFEQKWGDDPFTALGHTQIPNALIQYAARLTLAPDECWLITCILFHKRSPADPFPGQETLTAMFGRSVDTVQRIAKSIRAKGLLEVRHERSDLGHFSHIVYDFVPLRHALNECYYQDHPEQRPQYSSPSAMPQRCGAADGKPANISHTARMRYGRDAVSHTAKVPVPMPQECGANQTLKKKIEIEVPEFSASLFGGEEGTGKESEPEKIVPTMWTDLTPQQQEPFRAQAKRELLPYAIEAGPKAWGRMGPRQEEVRARNLYETNTNGKAEAV